MEGLKIEHKLEQDFEYNNCVKDADIYIRMGFIRKVYTILASQLLFTMMTVAVMFMFRNNIIEIMNKNPIIVIFFSVASFGILIAMFVKRNQTPANFICLFSFTIVESILVGLAVCRFNLAIVLQAMMITSAIVIGLTVFAMQTKHDFSSLGACLSSLLLALLVGGVTNIFFASTLLHMALSVGGAALFACLLVFDTQMIMERFSAEEYIAASITLYLDILNLFLYILRILNQTNSQ